VKQAATLTHLVMAMVLTLPLAAGMSVNLKDLPVKTLPSDAYAKLQEGKKLTYVFKAPGFNPSNGFKVGTVEYRAEKRVGEAYDYLKSQVTSMEKSGSTYTLNLAVIDAEPGKVGMVFGNNHGFFLVEGVVMEGNTPVAYFVTKEKGDFGGLGSMTLKPGVDKILSGITVDLFR